MLAYASHTDCHDEQFEDGLHIVFGSFNSPELSRSASFVAGARRFTLEPDSVMESCSIPDRGAPEGWMDQVEYVENQWKPYTGGTGQSVSAGVGGSVGGGNDGGSREH